MVKYMYARHDYVAAKREAFVRHNGFLEDCTHAITEEPFGPLGLVAAAFAPPSFHIHHKPTTYEQRLDAVHIADPYSARRFYRLQTTDKFRAKSICLRIRGK